MLRFDRLEKRFADGTCALDDVSFEVPKGQFCVVLGPSGAGKSTLLRAVNGLTVPSKGQVLVDGTPVGPASLRHLRPRIGMIHQQFSLVLQSSVAVNVLSGALAHMPLWRATLQTFPVALEKKAAALIAAVGLGEEHLRRRCRDLSGGQQQRVGIARAFMLDPAVVLADEPVASLDPKVSQDVLAILKKQAGERNAAVLCSLHQLDLAREFADRIVAMRQGRVIFDGAPDALTPTRVAEIYGGETRLHAVA
ncbi:MAG TPA: phosphonate ABC transporter ATP-binding protein [Rhizomicrobium sp.]|jgi:phosphonate transport system ATP-binding protein